MSRATRWPSHGLFWWQHMLVPPGGCTGRGLGEGLLFCVLQGSETAQLGCKPLHSWPWAGAIDTNGGPRGNSQDQSSGLSFEKSCAVRKGSECPITGSRQADSGAPGLKAVEGTPASGRRWGAWDPLLQGQGPGSDRSFPSPPGLLPHSPTDY